MGRPGLAGIEAGVDERDGQDVRFPNSPIREKAMSILNQAPKLQISNARAALVRNRYPSFFADREQTVNCRIFYRDKASIILNFSLNITRLFARLALFSPNCYHRSLSGTNFQKQRQHRREPLPDYGLVSIGV